MLRSMIARGQQSQLQACLRCLCTSSGAACSTSGAAPQQQADASTYSATSASTRAQEATLAALSRKGRFYKTVRVERGPPGAGDGWQVTLGERYADAVRGAAFTPSTALEMAFAMIAASPTFQARDPVGGLSLCVALRCCLGRARCLFYFVLRARRGRRRLKTNTRTHAHTNKQTNKTNAQTGGRPHRPGARPDQHRPLLRRRRVCAAGRRAREGAVQRARRVARRARRQPGGVGDPQGG